MTKLIRLVQLSKYRDNYKTENEDCIGHIQKRMGNALRNYKSDCHGTPADGKLFVGHGD